MSSPRFIIIDGKAYLWRDFPRPICHTAQRRAGSSCDLDLRQHSAGLGGARVGLRWLLSERTGDRNRHDERHWPGRH